MTSTAALESILDSSRVLFDPAALATYAIDGVLPVTVAKPASAEQAAEVIRFAAKEKLSVVPTGARTKISIGARPTRYDIPVEMCALNQIAQYFFHFSR